MNNREARWQASRSPELNQAIKDRETGIRTGKMNWKAVETVIRLAEIEKQRFDESEWTAEEITRRAM